MRRQCGAPRASTFENSETVDEGECLHGIGHKVACIHELTYNALPNGGVMPAMRDKMQAGAGAAPRTPTVVVAEED